MKNIVKFISVLALGLTLASCAKEAPSKSEVEAGFEQVEATLPQLTLGQTTVDAVAGKAEVELTISGYSGNLSVGVLSSDDPNFKTSSFAKVESPSNGTVKVTVKVTPNSTYYLKASAGSPETGSVYSATISLEVPDVPFWAKVAGTYSGNIESLAYGEAYTSVLTIISHPEDPQNKCYIGDVEPYYAAAGNSFAASGGKLNYVEATIDNENNTLTIAVGANMHLANSATKYRVFGGLNEEGSAFAPYVFKLAADGTSLIATQSYYTMLIDNGAQSAEDWYSGGTYVKL